MSVGLFLFWLWVVPAAFFMLVAVVWALVLALATVRWLELLAGAAAIFLSVVLCLLWPVVLVLTLWALWSDLVGSNQEEDPA